MRIAYVSTDDIHRARNSILFEGLQELGHVVSCYNFNAWQGIKDKTFATSLRDKFRVAFRYLIAYPFVLIRYAFSPRHDVVIIPYMGLFDVLAVWPLARLRREPVVWDAFISIYNTVVEDRKLLAHTHPLSQLLLAFETFVLKLPALILLDTESHVRYFQRRYQVPAERIASILVGSKGQAFHGVTPFSNSRSRGNRSQGKINVVFFGSFIPLHGLDTVIAAAAQTPAELAQWYIIGKGQEEKRIEEQWNMSKMANITRIQWMEYDKLVHFIDTEADVCLGIFGTTDKAARVIPNKFYDIVARSRPIITRDSEAIREVSDQGEPGVWLVPAGDSTALSEAVQDCRNQLATLDGRLLFHDLRQQIKPRSLADKLVKILEQRGVVKTPALQAATATKR